MITKIIELKLQYFKHIYVQARPPDKSVYQKIIFFISHPKHMYMGTILDLARTEARGQGHIDLEPVGDSPGPKMYLHTKCGIATINNIGDLLWVHFFKT